MTDYTGAERLKKVVEQLENQMAGSTASNNVVDPRVQQLTRENASLKQKQQEATQRIDQMILSLQAVEG